MMFRTFALATEGFPGSAPGVPGRENPRGPRLTRHPTRRATHNRAHAQTHAIDLSRPRRRTQARHDTHVTSRRTCHSGHVTRDTARTSRDASRGRAASGVGGARSLSDAVVAFQKLLWSPGAVRIDEPYLSMPADASTASSALYMEITSRPRRLPARHLHPLPSFSPPPSPLFPRP